MFYVDSSAIVALLAFEDARGRVRSWIGGCNSDSLHISPWVSTEVSSALSIKVRSGQLTLEQRLEAKATYAILLEDSLSLISIVDAHFETASGYIDNIALGLRGGDALHLAVSHANGLTLATLDKQLADAGPQLGVATLLL
jgi:predicted nucleic acid-binding protein